MSGQKKLFDDANARSRYDEQGTEDKLALNLRHIHCTMRALHEGKGSWRRVLIVLRDTGTMPQKLLTERLRIQPGSASDVLAKMEDMGLICRTPNREDQRTADVTLTEAGQREAQIAAEQIKQLHREMFDCLSAQEQESLLQLLEKINFDWDSRYRRA